MSTPLVTALKKALLGRRVLRVEDRGRQLVLDDGTTLTLFESAAECCSVAEGTWVVNPDNLDAVITGVKVKRAAPETIRDGWTTVHSVNITILHNQNPVIQSECSANDGDTGAYVSTLSLTVATPGGLEETLPVVTS